MSCGVHESKLEHVQQVNDLTAALDIAGPARRYQAALLLELLHTVR